VATTYRTRLVQNNQVLFDQVDLLQSDQFTRISGVAPSGVTITLMLNNEVVSWPLVSGVGLSNGQIAAGSVYWNELPNSAYGVRFFPTALGHWTLSIVYGGSPVQRISLDYDVVSLQLALVDMGLRVDFC
jgi:hypothetical protein